MKKLAYFIFGLSFLLLLVSVFSFLSYKPIETREINASVELTKDLGGFDLNSSALTFGKITLGGSVVRNLLFDNGYSFPVKLKIEVKGEITDLLVFQDSYDVKSGESISIPFTVVAKEDSPLGNYSGIVIVQMYKGR